jgi:4'-phosphopantetheinyl transferase
MRMPRYAATMMRLPLPEWPRPPSLPWLGSDEVHIWRVRLQGLPPLLSDLERSLSREEQARAARFHNDAVRASFVTGRGVLRRLLGCHLGLPPEAAPISLSARGKPECVSSGSDISFSLSHSGELVLVAMGRGRPVGVDVEYMDPSIPALQLARRFFAVEEAEAIASQKETEQLQLFYEIWVQKEACLKALGLGLSVPLDGFTVPPGCNPPVLYEPELWTHQGAMAFYGFSPWPTYVSALVTGPPVPQIRLLEWPTEGPYNE